MPTCGVADDASLKLTISFEIPRPALIMNSQSSSRTNAWVLLLFLTFLNVLNFVDRQLISSLAVPISTELKLEAWQIALLSGYAFAVLY